MSLSLMNESQVNEPAQCCLVPTSFSISSGTTDFLLYFGSISFREGSFLPPPHLLFSPTPPLASPPHLVSLSTGCVRVWQSFWNNVRVNNTRTHTRTHRMSVLNVNTMIFQRKVQTQSRTWSRGQLENSQYTKTWSKRRARLVGWMLNISSLSAVATGGMLRAKLTSWPCMRVLHWYLMHKHFSHAKSLQRELPYPDVMVPTKYCLLTVQTQVIRSFSCVQWWWSDLWTSLVRCWRCWTTRRSVLPPLTRWPPYETSWTRCRCQVQS